MAEIIRRNVNPGDIPADKTYIGLENIEPGGRLVRLGTARTAGISSTKLQFTSDDVLFGRLRPYLAKIAVPAFDGICSTDILPIRPGPDVDREYLACFLRLPETVALAAQLATGANLPRLNQKDLEHFQLPLPTLNRQKRIAKILGSVAHIRDTREIALSRAADLDASIFSQVFGDPVTNPKGWDDDRTLGDLTEIMGGVTKGRRVPSGDTQRVPYLSVSNVQAGRLDMQTVKEIDASLTEIEKLRLVKKDLVLTEGGDPDKLGRGALWDNQLPQCIHQNHVFRVRILDRKILFPEFLLALVSSERGRRYFLRAAKQTTGIASINKSQLKAFPLLLPPIQLQEQFGTLLKANASVKREMVAHVSTLDATFASLQSRAFKGEL